MDNDDFLKKMLKIVGIAALVAIPIFFICKKCQLQDDNYEDDDNSNIFSEELSA